MAIDIKTPKIAEGVDSAKVTAILVSEGDKVKKEQPLIEVETDKAVTEIPSSHAGKVVSIEVSEGDEIQVDSIILKLEESGEEEEDKAEDETGEEGSEEQEEKPEEESKEGKEEEDEQQEHIDEEEEEVEAKEKESKEKDDDTDKQEIEGGEEDKTGDEEEEKKKQAETEDKAEKEVEEEEKGSEEQEAQERALPDQEEALSSMLVRAAPGARRLARELGVDIEVLGKDNSGTLITKRDVKQYARELLTIDQEKTAHDVPDFEQWGEVEIQELSGIREATAKKVTRSWQQIPHVFQFEEADITGVMDYIEEHQEKAEQKDGHLTITGIMVKILAAALHHFPRFNASIDMANKKIILKKYIHIGVAVNTEAGLLVPVIRNADQKDVYQITVELEDLAEKARDRKLKKEDMEGGCITLSNLGGFGGTNFTPIIYPPQGAIVGVSQARKKPVYSDEQWEPRQILPLSLSYDHRLIDGVEGVHFITWIRQALEDPMEALMG